MGFFGDLWNKVKSGVSTIGEKVKQGLGSVFGANSKLGGQMITMAGKVTGGNDNFMDAVKHMAGGGLKDGFDYLQRTVIPETTDFLASKARNIPIVGSKVAAEIETLGKEAEDIADVEKSVSNVVRDANLSGQKIDLIRGVTGLKLNDQARVEQKTKQQDALEKASAEQALAQPIQQVVDQTDNAATAIATKRNRRKNKKR